MAVALKLKRIWIILSPSLHWGGMTTARPAQLERLALRPKCRESVNSTFEIGFCSGALRPTRLRLGLQRRVRLRRRFQHAPQHGIFTGHIPRIRHDECTGGNTRHSTTRNAQCAGRCARRLVTNQSNRLHFSSIQSPEPPDAGAFDQPPRRSSSSTAASLS